MFDTLPTDARSTAAWSWAEYEPFAADLLARPLSPETAGDWVRDWSALASLVSETRARLSLAYNQDTADSEAEARFFRFIEEVGPPFQASQQALKTRLLESGVTPPDFEIPLRNLQAEADLFRAANLPLQVEESKLGAAYDKIIGAQTVTWEGEELTLTRLRPVLSEPDRARREQAWRLMHARRLEDRAALDALWTQLFELRGRLAANADCADYRDFAWRQKLRFDYRPEDGQRFHAAIEEVCVPAATRVYDKHRRRLGLDRLRPWDLSDGYFGRPAPAAGAPALRPFRDGAELAERCGAIFERLDPALGADFRRMRSEALLDLDNRKGKSPGAYCTYFAVQRRPFIFMNAVGQHDDVQTLLHEAGHAFHAFASSALPTLFQRNAPMEFNEVASMAMELLAAPYFEREAGGFYDAAGAARARVEHLESNLLFWPYMAVVDAFQHWAYTHPEQAREPRSCDAAWRELWGRFIPGVDWAGLDDERDTGWHRKLHIFRVPFYYIEYGLASLGAAQVWARALVDAPAALAAYRGALALGGTASLPDLYRAAGARLAFDAETLGASVDLIERTIADLERVPA